MVEDGNGCRGGGEVGGGCAGSDGAVMEIVLVVEGLLMNMD